MYALSYTVDDSKIEAFLQENEKKVVREAKPQQEAIKK